jgi:outer membrane protein assembly factor BamB
MKLFLSILVLFITSLSFAQNWPQFRGSQALGTADKQNLPSTWDVKNSSNVVWTTKLPGTGHSSPVIWGNTVYVTTAVGSPTNWRDDSVQHIWKIFAIDKTNGKILWEKTAYEGKPRALRHEKASQCNSTPVTDGKYVAAFMGSEGLYVYSADGKELWRKDLGLLDPGLAKDNTSQWGHASSPIIYKDHLIVQIDKHKDSFLAAYRITDGTQIWKTERPDELPSWSTPTLHQTKGRVEIITNGQYVRGYDATSGKELWKFADKAEVKQPTPFVYRDSIIVTGGYPRGRPIYALKTGANGDISTPEGEQTNPNVTWMTERGGPYTPTPLAYGDQLYSVQNNGVVTCYDIKTGKKLYENKLEGEFSASPIASDGKIYFASEDGTISVLKAGPTFELLARNDTGSPCYATPAISDQTLFIRNTEGVIAIKQT